MHSDFFCEFTYGNVSLLIVTLLCAQVVFVASLVLTLLDFSPLVFLQEAEGAVGQLDVKITSDGSVGYVSVNYSQIAESVAASSRAEEVCSSNLYRLDHKH
jgi:hypothetical protein